VNDVGEPCAGEPHARFDAAAGGNPGPVGYAARSPDASRRPYDWAASRWQLLSSSARSKQTLDGAAPGLRAAGYAVPAGSGERVSEAGSAVSGVGGFV
jgi:hypothetical protein